MIFQAELDKARLKRKDLEDRLKQLTDARTRTINLLADLPKFIDLFEKRLAEARATGQNQLVPVYDPEKRTINEYLLDPTNLRRRRADRDNWASALDRLGDAKRSLDRKIEETEKRKAQVEAWIAAKEQTWGKIDAAKLDGQIRDILQSAEQLSRLIVGRKVEIAFDLSEDAALGYVPIRKKKRELRKVYLSAKFLGEQPAYLADYYRALIVHELGHILLHLKDSGKDFKCFRRLLRRKMTLPADFFPLFNIMLDEQLERILRDTKPEWQRWFNRLDFYTRQVPLGELRTMLAKEGNADPDRSIEDLAARRLIKVYPDPLRPFAVIQSASIFSESLGFSRMYAFFCVFRNRLPIASIREPWLTECLDCIPKDYKTLDVFGVYALTVKIYKIIKRGAGVPMTTMKVMRSGSDTPVEIEVPGHWIDGCEDDTDAIQPLTVWRKRRARQAAYEEQSQVFAVTGPSNLEGEPPPPEVRQQTYWSPPPAAPPAPSWWGTPTRSAEPPPPPTPLPDWAARAIEESKAPPAKTRIKSKHRSKRVSSKEKIRRRRADRDEARKQAQQSRPSVSEPAKPQSLDDAEKNRASDEVKNALLVASLSTPSWSANDASEGLNQTLDKLVNQIREQLAVQKQQTPTIDHMAADKGNPSDHRNTGSQREFPVPEQIIRLIPDRLKNLELTRSIKPFVNILRPYLAVLDPEKVLQEPLTGGRRLLASGLKKHMAYGETRIFADLRLNDTEQHSEVLVCVLVDTSSSMKNDSRLDRAKRLATILGEGLKDCPQVESVFLGYNENIYQCGRHDGHSISSLEPTGKTNEAAALDYLRKNFLEMPRRRKLVIVLSDGLPTVCTVESVRWLVHKLEKELGARFLYAALSSEEHPAYRCQANLVGEINAQMVRDFGRGIAALLR